MKSYKLVNSREVREKADRLGLEQVKCYSEEPFMLVYDGIYRTMCDNYGFSTCDFQEITQADFLALPEPLKVGDWVKFSNGSQSIIFKVLERVPDNVRHYFQDEDDEPYNLKDCAKLTQEQIDVLGLE